MSLRPTMRKTRNQIAKSRLSNNDHNENLPHQPQPKKSVGLHELKTNGREKRKTNLGVKRKAEGENCEGLKVARKRSAFGDITNAIEKALIKNGKTETVKLKATKSRVSSSFSSVSNSNHAEKLAMETKAPVGGVGRVTGNSESKLKSDLLDDSIIVLSQELKLNKITLDESNSYITASEGSPLVKYSSTSKHESPKVDFSKPPLGTEDFDRASLSDPYAISIYAMDIFNYYKDREKKFPIEKYVGRQPDVTRMMRAILVDWMVEVQESFELNHETLYLAVKLVDLYLSKVVITRDRLQLIGSTAIFIACKFDERTPPYVDDFLYICDDAYKRKELIALEIHMLKTLEYDLGIPLSYRFLRRYARCGKVSMETLTFARYILELSLMEYELIEVTDSGLASASLFLALAIKEEVTEWSPTLTYYSGYELNDFYHFVQLLHQMLVQPSKEHLKTIRNKYSHKVFFEVARIPIPEHLEV